MDLHKSMQLLGWCAVSGELVRQPQAELAANFMPVFSTSAALERYQAFKDFVSGVLKEGVDYGKNPGSDKDTLLKPGAEKLCTFFGLTPRYEVMKEIEDFQGTMNGQPLFYYKFKCRLYRGEFQMGEGIGSCSSWETKYRYRWADDRAVARLGLDKAALVTKGGVASEFEFAINKAETSGQYGKPTEYWAKWKQAIADGTARKVQKQKRDGSTSVGYEMDTTMYRVPNLDFADIINTVQKIGQKRAYVAATVSATNASDYFTQDMEDYIDVSSEPIDTGGHPVGTQAAANYVRDQKLQNTRSEPETPKESASAPAQAGAVNGASPSPQPPPPPTANGGNGKPLSEGLQSLWRQMFKPEARAQVFDMFHKNLIRFLGEEEGTRIFYGVLAKYKAKEARDLNRSLDEARKAARDLYEIVEPLLGTEAA